MNEKDPTSDVAQNLAQDITKDVAIVLVAAGRGMRSGGGIPKQYRMLAGRPVIARTLAGLARALPGARIVPVIHPDDSELFAAATAGFSHKIDPWIAGGQTRQQSVLAGLRALSDIQPQIVLIHDCARPFASCGLIAQCVQAAREHGAIVPALAISDALKAFKAGAILGADVDRNSVRAVQTPQAFSYALIRDAHERASAAGVVNLADDAAAAQWAGHVVHAIAGEAVNMKLTNPEDFRSAEAALAAQLCDIRTGLGYDVHAFGPGDHVWLGGLQIEHDAGLVGHSDADVLLHALTDAILGAIADGDIGSHFPPSDMQWKGAASDQFLRHAMELVAARGGLVAHLDATIICEAPKIGPHRDAIRANVAKICGLDLGRVAIKATTSEKLGFTGRREGIAVQAVATVRLPWGYW